MRILLVTLLVFGTQAKSDIDGATKFAQSLYADFAAAAESLETAAINDCSAPALKSLYQASFDAWIAASVIQFGPNLDIGGPLNFAFWPDKKGFTVKKLNQMIAAQDSAVDTPAGFSEVSVAGRGFMALERLLYDTAFSDYKEDSYTCSLARAISTDIRIKATDINAAWQGKFAKELANVNKGIGAQFLHSSEVTAAYLTSLTAGLEYIETARIARPLGTLERPRPKRAEAWRSLRSLRNIQISLENLSTLADALADGNAPETKESFETTIRFANSVTSRDFKDVADLSVRFQLESLSTLVNQTREAVTIELGQYLGVTAGFNALDGD